MPGGKTGIQRRLQEVRAGSDSAARSLLRTVDRYLRRTVSRHIDADLRQKVSESDLVQETMLAIHQQMGHFRGEHSGELRTWLNEILKGKVADARRKYIFCQKRAIGRERRLDGPGVSSHPLPEIADPGLTPSEIVSREERKQRIRDAMESLTDQQKLIYKLRFVERQAFVEIGREIGLSEDAARMACVRLIQKLGKSLDDE